MNAEELKQEVLNLAYQLGDPDGLNRSTIDYISSELGITNKQALVILNEALFDME